VFDAAWAVTFSLISLAALIDHGPSPEPSSSTLPSWLQILIPYASLAAISLVQIQQLAHGKVMDAVVLTASAVLGVIVLSRQFITLAENHRLLVALATREKRLRYLAFHDNLTGVGNRALFIDRLQAAIQLMSSGDRSGQMFVVVLADLDDFKAVNDTFGHGTGDELLVEVARRLRGITGPADTVARIGGDEFAMILTAPTDPEDIARTVLAEVTQPLCIAGRTIAVRMSIGLLRVGERSGTVSTEELMRDADHAMYAAKRQGKNNLVIRTASAQSAESDAMLVETAPGTHV
jgi:diguanylate cyclase (GGDEF)-like protein